MVVSPGPFGSHRFSSFLLCLVHFMASSYFHLRAHWRYSSPKISSGPDSCHFKIWDPNLGSPFNHMNASKYLENFWHDLFFVYCHQLSKTVLNILAQFNFVLQFNNNLLYSWLEAAFKIALQVVLSPGGKWNNTFNFPIFVIVIYNMLVVEVANLLVRLVFLLMIEKVLKK